MIRVDSGWWINIALKKDGSVWVWGRNAEETSGLAGDGENKKLVIDRPTRVPFDPPASIVDVATSGTLIIARDSKGRVWSWGGGAGSKENRGSGSEEFSKPHQLHNLPPVKAIAVGDGFSYALDTNGSLWGWGKFELMVFRPVRIAPEVRNFQTIYSTPACSYKYALTRDGKLFSWGRNKTGVLGDGVIPTGAVAEHPDSWNVPSATQVFPLTTKKVKEVPSKP